MASQCCVARLPSSAVGGVDLDGLRSARARLLASPNIVLITIDTLRADHCSAYGYAFDTTPRLEQLAREGARVETAYVPMPSTGPAHASLFTSRYPLAHQVLKNGHVLANEYPVLAEVLGGAGYRTAAFVSSFVLDDRFGYGQGFDSYDDDFRGADSSYQDMQLWEGIEVPGEFDRRAHETTDRAISWLRENGRRGGFFLWVHYMDPHEPYDPPEPWRTKYVEPAMGRRNLRRAVALYDAEIAFTDREAGTPPRRAGRDQSAGGHPGRLDGRSRRGAARPRFHGARPHPVRGDPAGAAAASAGAGGFPPAP